MYFVNKKSRKNGIIKLCGEMENVWNGNGKAPQNPWAKKKDLFVGHLLSVL